MQWAGPQREGSLVNWQQRLPGSVPVVCRRMHRVFWVPPRYRSLIAIGLGGTFTLREAAQRTGYSLHGIWAAMRSLEAMAIARFTSSRGRRGLTRMLLSSDASMGNVPPTDTTRDKDTNSDVAVRGIYLDAYKRLVAAKMRRAMGLPDEAEPEQQQLELCRA